MTSVDAMFVGTDVDRHVKDTNRFGVSCDRFTYCDNMFKPRTTDAQKVLAVPGCSP